MSPVSSPVPSTFPFISCSPILLPVLDFSTRSNQCCQLCFARVNISFFFFIFCSFFLSLLFITVQETKGYFLQFFNIISLYRVEKYVIIRYIVRRSFSVPLLSVMEETNYSYRVISDPHKGRRFFFPPPLAENTEISGSRQSEARSSFFSFRFRTIQIA